MQRKSRSTRNKLVFAGALALAAIVAAPSAMARGGYHNHGDRSADVLGALVVGAVIGGVLVSASQHDRGYRGDAYYQAPSYPAQGYYGSYPAYGNGAYYGNGGYYGNAGYGYGGRVNVGVVYNGHDNRWRRGDNYRGDNHNRYRYRGDRNGHYYARHGR